MVNWREQGTDTVAAVVDGRRLRGFRKTATAGPTESAVVLKDGVVTDAITEGSVRTRGFLESLRSLIGLGPRVEVLYSDLSPFTVSYWLEDPAVPHGRADGEGFGIPVVPIAVNCYGRGVVSQRGGALPVKVNGVVLEPDPPGPTPKRCMQVGAALARVLKESPYRVALVASSSWSHAFLTAQNNYLWPDTPSDREMLSDLKKGNYAAWSERTTAQLEDAGQHELLNWACLLGAMEELGGKPDYVEFVETNVLTSNKCFATFTV